MVDHPELGFYLLPGGSMDPRDLVEEVRAGEALGLGAAFICPTSGWRRRPPGRRGAAPPRCAASSTSAPTR